MDEDGIVQAGDVPAACSGWQAGRLARQSYASALRWIRNHVGLQQGKGMWKTTAYMGQRNVEGCGFVA